MFSKIKKYVIGFFVLCSGLLVAFLSGKGAGRRAEKIGKLDETLKSVKKDLKAREKKKNGTKRLYKVRKKLLKKSKNLNQNPKRNLLKKLIVD